MHTQHLYLIVLISAIFLPGCETLTKPRYIEPEGENYATIHSYKHNIRFSNKSWNQYQLYSIDDMLVYSLTSHTDPEKIADFRHDDSEVVTKIQEGEHNLVIDATFHRGERSGPFVSKIPLTFSPARNGVYRLNGEVSGKTVKVWVENYSTGERVSEVESGESVCTGCKMVVPIFIPVSR